MTISAYNDNNKIVEGKAIKTTTGKTFVLYEGKYLDVNKLHYVRFFEDDGDEVDKQVAADINSIKKNLEDKKPSENDIEKAGENRAKELKNAGMKEKEPDEYKTKFMVQAAAVVTGADSGIDATKAASENSEALKNLTESDEPLENEFYLHSDYHDAPLYNSDVSRDEVYQKIKDEIESYKNETNHFDDDELVEYISNKFLRKKIHGSSLKESFQIIVSEYMKRV